MTKNIVVFGGTGQQGSALVRALGEYNTPSPQFTIYLLARNPVVGSLAQVNGVKVIHAAQNYMNDPEAAFKATGLEKGHIHGVFSVNSYLSEKEEVAQGVAVAEAAAEWQVKHFVYASVWHDDTVASKADGFDAKRAIERVIKRSAMGWTMLYSTDFMDNWLPSQRWKLKAYRTMLLRRTFYNHPERKIATVSTRDIGRAGAMAFAQPDKYLNCAMPLSGDLLDIGEIQSVYEHVMGEPITETYGFVAGMAKWAEPSLGQLSKFYDEEGYSTGPEETRKFLPATEDFRSFLERYKREQSD